MKTMVNILVIAFMLTGCSYEKDRMVANFKEIAANCKGQVAVNYSISTQFLGSETISISCSNAEYIPFR